MQCPICHTEMRIQSNDLVKKTDGTLAYKMELKCRSRECANYDKVVSTIYTPVEIKQE